MNYAHPTGQELPALVLTTGVVVSPRIGDPAQKGVTLASGTTYVFALGGESAPLESIHIVWDAAIVVVFTVEDSNMPSGLGGPGGAADISNFDSSAGGWVQENPTSAYIAISAGASATNLTITTAGTTAGGAIVHLGNFGTRRSRLKATVGGTGGVVRVMPHGKA
jgi:hypothetical protein